MKKIFFTITMLISLTVLFFAFGTTASALSYGDLSYTVSAGEVTITNCVETATEIEIPEEIDGYPVTDISSYAFKDCTMLEKLYWNAKYIDDIEWGNSTFANAGTESGGIEVVFGDNVEIIPDNCFANGNWTLKEPNIKKVTIGNSVTTIGSHAFYKCGITEIIIPDSVTFIGDNAFQGCSIKSVEIPDSVTHIGDSAFRDSALKSVIFPHSITSLPESMFSHCDSLNNVVIPDTVTRIGTYAFNDCDSLTEIIIPDSVTYIGSSVFFNCRGLSKVYWNSDCWVDSTMFYNAGSSVGGFDLIFGDSVESIFSLESTNVKSVVIPDSVKNISSWSFSYCTLLETVKLGNSVESIGNDAFSGCFALSSINFPESLTSVGDGAFKNCKALTYVLLPDNLESLGIDVFYNCIELETACLSENSLVSIPEKTFYGCSKLSKIYIPANITSFGENAFRDCSQLADIYFGGTEDDWNRIEIAESNNAVLGANIHFNHEHTFTEWTVIQPVEKYKDGVESSNCTACMYEERRAIRCGHEHHYVYSVITPPTCATTGEGYYECECAHSYTEIIPVVDTGHDYKSEKIEVSCAQEGCTKYTCTKCSKTYSENIVERLPHSKSGNKCAVCGTYIICVGEEITLQVSRYILASIPDIFWDTDTGNVSVNNIDFGIPYSSATIRGESVGADKIMAYDFYDSVYRFNFEVVNHTPGAWVVKTPAKVGVKGLEQQKCTDCGKVMNERDIPALPEETEKPVVTNKTGDANGDGKITAADARIVLRISAKLEKIENYNIPLTALDVTGDGKITAADARKILRISAKLE